MTLTVDSSTAAPVAFSGNGGAAGTSPATAFTLPANSLVVATFASVYGFTVTSMEDMNGNAFTKLIGNAHGGDVNAEIWGRYYSTSQADFYVSCVTNSNNGSNNSGLGVIVFDGANSSQAGAATESGGSYTGLPSGTLNTTANGSMVLTVVASRYGSAPADIPSGQSTTINGHSFTQSLVSNEAWAALTTSPVSTSGTTVNLGDSGDSAFNTEWTMVALEILAAAAGPPVNTAAPVISGTINQGQTLTTTNGTWTGSPTGYTYQWVNSTTGNISGATASTYVLQASDVGDDITCVVTATNGSGNASATSNSLGPILIPAPGPGNPPVIGDPAIITSGFFAS
jgi:hypothetical protein